MKKLFKLSSCLLFIKLLFIQNSFSSTVYIQVGQAKTKKSIIAISQFKHSLEHTNAPALSSNIRARLKTNFEFMDIFTLIPEQAFLEPPQSGVEPGQFNMSHWSGIAVEFLIKAELIPKGNTLELMGYLYDVKGSKPILAKKYVGKTDEVETMANFFANDIVQTLTGLPGIFLTKIAMNCDQTKNKEIFVMDFDGRNVKKITNHRSIAFAPAWHPKAEKLAYSVYTTNRKTKQQNIDLYEYDFKSNKIELLSNRNGINSGAAYSPDGKSLAVTMSFLGNPDIFILDPSKKSVTRKTKSFGFDVDPSFSPDGEWLVFSSSRAGNPMLYRQRMNSDTAERLTIAGRYNATPSWSPQNNKIAFSSWVDGRFDIFTINPNGTNLERLTKNQGSNEDPYFSPDGQYIAFMSDRAGSKNIYVMNIDGTYTRRLTYGLGNCVAPKWSN